MQRIAGRKELKKMQRCYICNEEMGGDWRIHVQKKHFKHELCFNHLMVHNNDSSIIPVAEDVVDVSFSSGYDFDGIIAIKKAKLGHRLFNSAILQHIEPLPERQELPARFIPIKLFGNFFDCVTAIRKTKTKDITKFMDYTAQILCQHCGGYNKRKTCPPNIKDTFQWQESLNKFEYCFIVVLQSDGRASSPKRPDGGERQWGRSLLGADVILSLYMVTVLQEIVAKLRVNKYHLAKAGPCKGCFRGCNLMKGLPCPHPIMGGVSLEGMGFDVTGIIQSLNIPIQQPCLDFVTKVGAIFC
jgi:predicted metal-binding protein